MTTKDRRSEVSSLCLLIHVVDDGTNHLSFPCVVSQRQSHLANRSRRVKYAGECGKMQYSASGEVGAHPPLAPAHHHNPCWLLCLRVVSLVCNLRFRFVSLPSTRHICQTSKLQEFNNQSSFVLVCTQKATRIGGVYWQQQSMNK